MGWGQTEWSHPTWWESEVTLPSWNDAQRMPACACVSEIFPLCTYLRKREGNGEVIQPLQSGMNTACLQMQCTNWAHLSAPSSASCSTTVSDLTHQPGFPSSSLTLPFVLIHHLLLFEWLDVNIYYLSWSSWGHWNRKCVLSFGAFFKDRHPWKDLLFSFCVHTPPHLPCSRVDLKTILWVGGC